MKEHLKVNRRWQGWKLLFTEASLLENLANRNVSLPPFWMAKNLCGYQSVVRLRSGTKHFGRTSARRKASGISICAINDLVGTADTFAARSRFFDPCVNQFVSGSEGSFDAVVREWSNRASGCARSSNPENPVV